MLVISRKEAQAIKIGRDITIKVIELSSGKVKLGVEAPKNIRITRVDDLVDDKAKKIIEKIQK